MKNVKIELKWAVIFIIMMLLWMIMEKAAGFHDKNIDKHFIISMFVAIPAIAIYVLALKDKRNNYYNGIINYQQGFITGLILTVFITLLTPLLQYVISTYITPEFFKNLTEYAVEKGLMTRVDAMDMFNLKSYMIQATIGSFIMGTVTSAIVAIFTRKSAV